MPKVTFIGAGSIVFARNLMGDILSFPELQESAISLMDIDQRNCSRPTGCMRTPGACRPETSTTYPESFRRTVSE